MDVVMWTGSGLVALAWVALLIALLSCATAARRIRIRIRRPRPLRSLAYVTKGLSVLGFALSISSTPALAQGRPPAPPVRATQDAPAPPWTAAGGSPPPRPPVPFEASPLPSGSEEGEEVSHMKDGSASPAVGSSTVDGTRRQVQGSASDVITIDDVISDGASSGDHPAIHGVRGTRVDPLFPRLRKADEGLSVAQRLEREDAMRRHPAGKGLSGRAPAKVTETEQRVPAASDGARTWTVEVGDSLWGIAGEVLGTDDLVRIARYWPRIHRMNPEIADPNLVFPGQVLRLPNEEVR